MEEKIIEIIAKELDIESVKINLDTLILEELGAHSLDVIEIITDIEDTFNIAIPDEAIPDFKAVGDIIKYIESQQP